MAVKIKTKQTGRVRGPNLSDPQLKAIGDKMVESQLKRWSEGINTSDQPAKKLSVKYAIIKQKYLHKRPKRDNYMTGALVKNFKLRKAASGTIRAENTTRLGRAHAKGEELFESMIGLSATDQGVVLKESFVQYGNYLTKAWIPIRG